MDVNFNMNNQLNYFKFGCIIMPKLFKEFLNIKDGMVSKNEDSLLNLI